MISDDVYRPPAIEPEANHSTFAPDEWRYKKKVFAAWILGGSVFMALYETLLFGWSLSQFGGEEYTARVVLLDVFARSGTGVVIFAACNTLVMVTHRRTKAEVLEPVQHVPLWIPGVLGLTTPIAITLILGLSLALITYRMGVPWTDSWKGIQTSVRWTDFVISILCVVVITALVTALIPQVMRLLFRFRGWLILKFIVIAFAIAPILSVVRLVWNVIVAR
jgi:hypothetical protein